MRYGWAIGIFVVGELISWALFAFIKHRLSSAKNDPSHKASTAKGILERVVLFTGLLYGFPQILIVFGALKLGTRLHQDGEKDISNTYFLVGNLTSILLAMVYVIITRILWEL